MSVGTIMIFRIGSIGDTVVALPCFHHVARRFPDSRRILITDIPASQKAASVESILRNSGLIDGVIRFPPPPRNASDFLKLRTQIRETKSKTLIYSADRDAWKTLRDVCFFRLCGIQQVIGASLSRDVRFPRVNSKTGETEPELARLARCLAALGSVDLDHRMFWDLRLQPAERDVANRCLAPLNGRDFIAINAGGKVQIKDWGNERWVALLRLMADQHADLALVFIGSADEFDRSSKLAAVWPGRTLNLCGRLAPRESAAAMQRAVLFVGHDSGPMHLAAATGVSCVAMFGNFNKPRWWHPAGKGHRVIHNMRGIREISPGEVYAAVRATLAEASARKGSSTVGVDGERSLLHMK